MASEQVIHVADAVRFLAAFAPSALDELRGAHPDPSAQAALQPEGAVLGAGAGEREAAIDAAETFLREIDSASLGALRRARRTLKLASIAELVGKLLALASTGTLIALLLDSTQLLNRRSQAIALAALGFLSAAVPLVVAFMRGSLTDASGLQKHYKALGEASFEARVLRASIADARNKRPPDSAALAALVDQANALARTAYAILADLGYDEPAGSSPG